MVATEGGGWEIHYSVYLTDPATGKPKRHHCSRVVGYKPKMHRADAEKILGAELAAINGGPVTRATDGTITFGNWMRNFYIPMRGAKWRDATRRTIYTQITDREVARMVNQVTNRILGLGEEVEPGSVQ